MLLELARLIAADGPDAEALSTALFWADRDRDAAATVARLVDRLPLDGLTEPVLRAALADAIATARAWQEPEASTSSPQRRWFETHCCGWPRRPSPARTRRGGRRARPGSLIAGWDPDSTYRLIDVMITDGRSLTA